MGRRLRTRPVLAAIALGCLILLGVLIARGPLFSSGLHTLGAKQPRPTSAVHPAATATGTPVPLPPGNDWPQYRYDVAGSGTNPEGVITSGNASLLRVRWQTKADSGFLATPAVVGGVVYATARDQLHAYDLATGHLLWSTPVLSVRASVNSSVAVDAARHLAFFGTSLAQLYAVNTTTHQLAWIATLDTPARGAYLWSSPLVVNGTVYVGMASHNDNPCVRGAIYALDEQTGVARWTHYTVPEGVLGGAVWSSVTADVAHHLIVATTGNPCPEGPVTDEEDSIVAMDWDSGLTAWSYQGLSYDDCDCDFGQGAAIYSIGDTEYVVAGSKYGELYAVSPDDNGGPPALAWSNRISRAGFVGKGGMFTPPTYANGILVAAGGPTMDGACPQGALQGFKADTGELLWRVCTASQVIGAPAASGGAIFVAAGSTLTAYSIKTGKQLWQAKELGTEIWGGVAISHGYVLSGTLPGSLFAYALPARSPSA